MTGTILNKALACVAGALVLGASASVSFAETAVLKFSTMEPPTGPLVQCFSMPLLNELKEASKGRIEFETYMGGSGFANPIRQYEQVARGRHGHLSRCFELQPRPVCADRTGDHAAIGRKC